MRNILIFLLFYSYSLFSQNYALPYSTSFASHAGYFYEYSAEHKQSKWVAYKLVGEDVKKPVNGDIKFYNDDKLPSGAISNEDFIQRAFVPGHLKPSGDARASTYDMHDAYLFANISPMKPTFNEITWNILENMVRGWAVIYDSLYVVSGPVFVKKENIDTIGPHKVPVPDYFFKVVLVYNGIDMQAIGFILPNVDVKYETEKSPLSIDSVEKFTGYDFFYQLPDYLEQHLEAKTNTLFWQGQNNSFKLKESFRRKDVQCVATDAMDSRCTRITSCLNATCTNHGCEGEKK